jgi:hypothetical protein
MDCLLQVSNYSSVIIELDKVKLIEGVLRGEEKP